MFIVSLKATNDEWNTALSFVPLQLPLSPMRVFAIGIEPALDVAVDGVIGKHKQKKTAGRRSLFRNFRFDQAATSALFRRRYVIAPTPAKPRIIIAQVEGSGTEATTCVTESDEIAPDPADVLKSS
jgi:hypothetical protein